MKKRLTLLLCSFLVSILAFSTACSNTDLSKFLPEIETRTSLAKLSLTKADTIVDDDEFGLMIIKTPTYDAEENVISTKYRLYNSRTDTFIDGAVSDVLVDSEPADDALSFSVSAGIHYLTDGMYALATINGSRESVSEEFDIKIKVELFGKNGKAGETEFDETVFTNDPFDSEKEIFTDWSGVRYYVNVKGNLVKENNVFEKIITYSDVYYSEFSLANYYCKEGEIYDLDGKYVRSVDYMHRFGINSSLESEPMFWSVGDYIFLQYCVREADDAKDYDFEEIRYENQLKVCKYSLITKRYDVKNDKVKDVDFNAMVQDCEYYGDSDSVFLYYSEIKDKKLYPDLIQCFDKDLKVAFDVQKLVPGAYGVDVWSESMFIYSMNGMSVVVGKEVVNVFDSDVDAYANSVVLQSPKGDISIYDLNGQLKKSYENVVDYTFESNYEPTVYLELEDSYVSYNLLTHQETVYATYDKETENIYISAFYVQVTKFGEDGEYGTLDDVMEIRFLIDGMQSVTLQYGDEIDVVYVGSYYEYSNEKAYDATIIRVTIYDADTDTSTVEYYRTEMVATIA